LSEGGQLLSKKIVLFFTLLVILYASTVPLSPDIVQINTPRSYNRSSDPMIIESDSDFETYGWSGNGSDVNPYLLSQEEFEGEGYIRIRNTRSHFRLENCTFNMDFNALELANVTNAVVSNNSIVTKGHGFSLYHCDSVIVLHNTIRGGDESLQIFSSNNTSVINNTMACMLQAVWLYTSTNITLFGNELATVEVGYTAVDEFGVNNCWDDGISLGNAWYDYNGTGVYRIPGSTNSTDHFPTIFYPHFPIDFEGPIIRAPGGSLYVDYIDDFPSHWRFEARVSDPSGVEIVTITVNDAIHEMTHQPAADDPDLYVYDHPNPRYMTYSFWAVDSLGYETEEPGGFISIGVFGSSSRPPTLAIILLQIGAISTIIILTMWWKRDVIRDSRFLKGATRIRSHQTPDEPKWTTALKLRKLSGL
jgi:hypothetical protein